MNPADLLAEHASLFAEEVPAGPVLDLACGRGENGLFLAGRGLKIVLADRSGEALSEAARLAQEAGVEVELWPVDLEREGVNPLPEEAYGGILVFRYLHRPLIPCIRKALRPGGLLFYETYTTEQPRFGKPRNPAFLLQPGELRSWFEDWQILHYFEGLRTDPPRAVAQLVARKKEGTLVLKSIS